jgi:hypothetical protein
MKKLVIAGLAVFCMFLLAARGRASAQTFSNASFTGRFSCQGGSQGYYSHSSTGSWVVVSKGNGYFSTGEGCFNQQGTYGPCECLCYLNTSYSTYSVDSFGLVSESLSWHSCSGSSYCPSYFTDNVGAALSLSALPIVGTVLGTNFTDDNLADAGEPGNGTCNR